MSNDLKYETLMNFLLTELSQPTLKNIEAAADKRFHSIYEMVMKNPEAKTGAIEGVLEDLLHRLEDYIPEDQRLRAANAPTLPGME